MAGIGASGTWGINITGNSNTLDGKDSTDFMFKILAGCSGKTYATLTETYGKKTIDELISNGYIAVLENKTIVRTELGLNLSKPMGNSTNEKLGQEGYQLIVDSSGYAGDGQLLLS